MEAESPMAHRNICIASVFNRISLRDRALFKKCTVIPVGVQNLFLKIGKLLQKNVCCDKLTIITTVSKVFSL